MKTVYFLAFLFISVYSSYAQLPTNGLIAEYKFNKDLSHSANYIDDSSGNNNNGEIFGGVSYTEDRYGVGCSAAWFDGNGYISVPNSASLKSPQNAFTATVWFKIANGAHLFQQWITIFCKSDIIAESYESPQYRMQATAQTVSINSEFTENFIPQLSYDVWYFYAYTYDGSKVKVFLNGNPVFEYPYNGRLNQNNMPLEIGRDLPGKQEYFFGAMDDLRLYKTALSESEIQLIYSDQSGQNNADRCNTQPLLPVSTENTTTTVVNTPIPPPSPPPPADTVKTDLPKELTGIPVDYQKTIKVKSRKVRIYPYDNEKEDGDIVSININGIWVKDNYLLKKKLSNPPISLFIEVELNSGEDNYLISKAWNTGSISPNTLTIEIDDGSSVQKVTINSEEGLSGGIKIVCEE